MTPPPLAVELTPEVAGSLRRDPALTGDVNMVLLRAARRVLAAIAMGEQRITLHGGVEQLRVSLDLAPPNGCRVVAVTRSAGRDGAIAV